MIASLCSRYVGIPFKARGRTLEGLDCWGLVALLLNDIFRISAPEYDEDPAEAEKAIEAISSRDGMLWPVVSPASARPGDVLIFRLQGKERHCALLLDNGYFIHSIEPKGVCIERLNSLLWRSRLSEIRRWNLSQ